jgi:hypothetical protein
MLTDEFPMMGNFDNDYAYGDYVCHCNRCGVQYHGPDHTLICFKCYSVQFMEELERPVAINFWPIVKLFIIVAVTIAVILI